ncbi:uncharacterized protein LOC120338897 [Styela clava]|uniref:uncharacterized protein LOC120338897 n=1 Tax=Styela clava TaxID=7725 RepID=UPI00193A0DA9|nr:uncharacterized protein LOC120338897 [Styela clava]
MDMSRPPCNKTKIDTEKLVQAIKKAKSERARKAVNRSLDRSIGSIKRRKKREASSTQAHCLKQAVSLQQKNEDIVATAIKAKQYNRQLAMVNYHFEEQHRIFSATIASDRKKINLIEKENCHFLQESHKMDKMLSQLQKHLRNAGIAIDSVKNDNIGSSHDESKNISITSDSSVGSELSVSDISSRNDSVSEIDEKIETDNITNHETVYMELTAPNTNCIEVLQNVPNTEFESEDQNSSNQQVFIETSPINQMTETKKALDDYNNEMAATNVEHFIDENNQNVANSLDLPDKRLSQRKSTNSENCEPSRRSSRRSATEKVSYAEPNLSTKLRRGDKMADESLFKSFTPRKKYKSNSRVGYKL